jgi:hypothetical protein
MSADHTETKMPGNRSSTRQTETFPAPNLSEPLSRKFTREQGHKPKTPDILGQQNDGYTEGQKISGATTAAPAIPLDIILPHLELFCFSGQVCKLHS